MELRYSPAKFQNTVLIALLLTAMITGVTWMIMTGLRSIYADSVAAIVALVFFVFVSIGMLWRYYNREVIFAVRRSGLLDRRWSPEIIGWDEIKEIVLLRRESEFELEVRLWPEVQGKQGKSHLVDLSPFDTAIQQVVDELKKYAPVRQELR